jgi:undecaprenyl-diphosphatase
MDTLQIIILSIVEGITEFLPISSTAHIDIARELLGIVSTDFIKSFEITIQLGAICAVLFLYGKHVLKSARYIRNVIIAFIPTAIIGFILYKVIKSFLLGNILLAAVMLVVGGIVIIVFERRNSKEIFDPSISIETLPTKKLLLLGVAQALAVVPGVSRSGAVIIGGRALGLSKTLITEFSFVLAVPTMFAAVVYDLYKSGFAFTSMQWGDITLGFVVSFIIAFIVIKWLLSYIKTHSFELFGWYRVVVGAIIIIYISVF